LIALLKAMPVGMSGTTLNLYVCSSRRQTKRKFRYNCQ